MVEFGWLRITVGKPPVIWLVEAKSSAPNPSSPLVNAKEKLAEYFADIRDKMENALGLTIAACLERHQTSTSELPKNWKSVDLRELGFRFILVVKGHHKEWLPPLGAELNKFLRTCSRLWVLGGDPAIVLNEELAQKYGLLL